MTFTSPSAVNKNNKFHIGPVKPKQHIQVIIQESVIFNILQRVSLLIPAFSMSSKDYLSVESKPTKIECIQVERVMESSFKSQENIVKIDVQGTPKKIISCDINNITLKEKLIPCVFNDWSLVIAIYNYQVELKYIDFSGNVCSASKMIYSRHQRAFIKKTPGKLKVNMNISCIYSKICPNSKHSVQRMKKNLYYTSNHKRKSIRVWIKGKSRR